MSPWWLRTNGEGPSPAEGEVPEERAPTASPSPPPSAARAPVETEELAPEVAAEESQDQDDAAKSAPSPRRQRRRRGGRRRRRPPRVEPAPEPTLARPGSGAPAVGDTAEHQGAKAQRVTLPSSPPRPRLEPMGPLEHPRSEPAMPGGPERKIALLWDFENIALGVRESRADRFDVNLILERLLEKGKIIVKKAYADWERYREYKRPLHEAAIELIDIPQRHYSGKNSADIKMVVDAMDLCYSKDYLDTFVVVSGDSDFSPLVSKLKEHNKTVIGIGVKNASSSLLIDNCDEFIFYEDIWRDMQNVPHLDHLSAKEAELFELLADAVLALMREGKEVLWGSMIKQTMQRKRPSFNEGHYGYRSFSEFLRDAEHKNIIALDHDPRSGTDFVTGFATRI